MAEKKHLSKKELKEDPFFEDVAHVISFFRNNYRLIMIVVVILAVIVSGFFIGRSVLKQRQHEASGYFGMAMDAYNKNELMNAEDQFMLLAESYANTEWGRRAYFYLAMISRAQDRPENETIDYLEYFVGSNPDDKALLMSAWQLIGSYYEKRGDLSDAGNAYFSAAKNAFTKSDKLDYGLRAAYAFKQDENASALRNVIAFLDGLDLNAGEKNRVEVLR